MSIWTQCVCKSSSWRLRHKSPVFHNSLEMGVFTDQLDELWNIIIMLSHNATNLIKNVSYYVWSYRLTERLAQCSCHICLLLQTLCSSSDCWRLQTNSLTHSPPIQGTVFGLFVEMQVNTERTSLRTRKHWFHLLLPKNTLTLLCTICLHNLHTFSTLQGLAIEVSAVQ